MKSILTRVALLFALLFATAPAFADQSSLCMPTATPTTGLAFAIDINGGFKALVTAQAGAGAPTNDCTLAPVRGQFWLDTGVTPAIVRMYDGAAWQATGALDASTNIWTPPVGGGATSVASAATTDLWSVAPSFVTVTGTTTITKLAGSSDAVLGTMKDVVFSGALILTQDPTQLILPGARSILTAAGDTAKVVALGGGNVRVVDFSPASGLAVNAVPAGHVDQFVTSTCPVGWLAPDGTTIGDAASGASGRANSDTFALYADYWNLDPTVSAILTSAGAGSTRGVSAAADFAAHKRLTSPDMRAQFLRGLDNSRGVDTARLLGSSQPFSTSASGLSASASSSATSTFVGSPMQFSMTLGFSHGTNGNSTAHWSDGDTPGGAGGGPTTNVTNTNTPTGGVSTSVTTTVGLSGSAETRGVNVAVLTCLKL